MNARPWFLALERFLLPNACVACDRRVEPRAPDALLCGLCRSRARVLAPGCARCGQPLPPVGPCRFCADWPTALRWVRSGVWLDAVARPLVHHLKYQGLPALAADLADLIGRRVTPQRPTILIPIPLAAKRLRHRGYNQATALARGLGRQWGVPVAEHIVSRVRDTGTQTALTPEARAKNVAGAFVARPPPVARSAAAAAAGRGGEGVQAILIDDVLTTGATLVAATQALVAAGWSSVGAVTFARALPYELRAAG